MAQRTDIQSFHNGSTVDIATLPLYSFDNLGEPAPPHQITPQLLPFATDYLSMASATYDPTNNVYSTTDGAKSSICTADHDETLLGRGGLVDGGQLLVGQPLDDHDLGEIMKELIENFTGDPSTEEGARALDEIGQFLQM